MKYQNIAGTFDSPVAPTTDLDFEVLVGNPGFSISTRPGGSTGEPSDGLGVRHWRDMLLADYRRDGIEQGLKGKALGAYAWGRLAETLEVEIASKVNPRLKTRGARIKAIQTARDATAAKLFVPEDVLMAGLKKKSRRR